LKLVQYGYVKEWITFHFNQQLFFSIDAKKRDGIEKSSSSIEDWDMEITKQQRR
jgi:hypothetical protein